MDYLVVYANDTLGYLSHHGTKGMKWGVWNEETRKRYTSSYPTIDGYTKKKLGYKDDVVIPKGEKVYRTSKNKKDTGDWRYVSADANSRDFYRNSWGKDLQNLVYGKKTPIYEHEYVLKEDLRSPGLKKRTEALAGVFNEPEFKDAAVRQGLTFRMKDEKALKSMDAGRAYVEKALAKKDPYVSGIYDNYSKQFDKMYKKADKYLKADTAAGVIPTSDILKKKYGDRLRKEGYNAILDDNGAFAGVSRIGDIPMIALTPGKSLKQTGYKKVDFKAHEKLTNKYPEHSIGERQWADKTRQDWGKKKGAFYAKNTPATVREQLREKTYRKEQRHDAAAVTVAAVSVVGMIALSNLTKS